ALFNNAQLAFELSYDPYNGAIKALKHFITNFPESKRLDEAYGYLVNLFLSTNNYKEALSSMEKIKSKDEKLKPAYQRIAHFRGVELYNDKNYNEAISYFKKSLDYNFDKEITAANYYWIAEAFYHQLSYKQAINYYDRFLTTPDAEKLDYHNLANYNLGYCWFKQKDYHSAINGFKKFIKAGYTNQGYIADASLRVGDCYFIGKRYDDAITWYDRAIKYEGPDSDYGLFQKAYALGGKGDFNQKVSTLNELLDKFPGSANHDNTLFELGTTFLILNKDEDALLSFTRITNEYPLSPLIPKSLLKTGMIYYNRNSNDLAINTLKKVIEQYPGTTESHEALESLQNIYVDLNRVNDFFSYASQFPFANISRTEQDSLTYFASENLYLSGEYLPAIEGFSEYIKQFPQGSFFIHAHYYKADCEYRSDNMIEALKDYLFIINQPPNKYTETAYARAAIIEFDKEQYEQALEHFISLEELAGNKNNQTLSITGQMRCNFLLGFDEATLESAGKLIQSLNPDAEIAGEAHFVMAKSAYNLGKTSIALDEFQQVCHLDQGMNAAESQYYIAEIAFINNDFQEAEKQTFELINKYPSYDYWVAKGFILLADVYLVLDNAFQAKQTLQSIIDNYDGDDLTTIAKQKLDAIIAMEESDREAALEEESEGLDDDEF
ncbi:MAG: tetratricopeptide repeat protein, partial [Bacteroidales bacterium]|nr:tetratricopeptide repeat protein [Bacteroidales bacterium]